MRAMNNERIAKVSKALADPTRLRIYQMIAAKSEIVCGELVAMEGVTPGTVSHHLKVLTEAELIECNRQGQFVCSRVLPKTMKDYVQALTVLSDLSK